MGRLGKVDSALFFYMFLNVPWQHINYTSSPLTDAVMAKLQNHSLGFSIAVVRLPHVDRIYAPQDTSEPSGTQSLGRCAKWKGRMNGSAHTHTH